MKHRALGAGWAAVSELGKFAEGVRGGFSAMAFSTGISPGAARAAQAFAKGDYATTSQILEPMINEVVRIGGAVHNAKLSKIGCRSPGRTTGEPERHANCWIAGLIDQ